MICSFLYPDIPQITPNNGMNRQYGLIRVHTNILVHIIMAGRKLENDFFLQQTQKNNHIIR